MIGLYFDFDHTDLLSTGDMTNPDKVTFKEPILPPDRYRGDKVLQGARVLDAEKRFDANASMKEFLDYLFYPPETTRTRDILMLWLWCDEGKTYSEVNINALNTDDEAAVLYAVDNKGLPGEWKTELILENKSFAEPVAVWRKIVVWPDPKGNERSDIKHMVLPVE